MPNTQGGSTDFVIAQSAVDDSAKGARTWNNPENVTADDGTNADVSVNNSNESHWLRASFDFQNKLPINANITGLVVRVQASGQAGTVQRVIEVQLHNGTAFIGTAKTPNTTIPDSATDLDFGGAEDTWDATLNLIQIGFCDNPVQVGIRVDSDAIPNRTVNVDAMWMKIYFGGQGGNGGSDIWLQRGNGGGGPTIPGSAGDFI